MSGDERKRFVKQLDEIDEELDEALLQLAALACLGGGGELWNRLDARLGLGTAERAALLLVHA